MANARSSVHFFSKQNLFSLISLLIGIVGIITGVVIPLWQTYWIQTPFLSVELSSINRIIAKDASIPKNRYVELAIFESPVSDNPCEMSARFYPSYRPTSQIDERSKFFSDEILTHEEMKKLLTIVKKEIKQLPEQISSLQRALEDFSALTAKDLTLYKIRMLNEPILLNINFNFREFEEKTSAHTRDEMYFQSLLEGIKRVHQDCISRYKNRLDSLEIKLPIAESRLESINDDLLNEQSLFIVKAVLVNSGRSNVSIKEQSLLRVYSRTGNYVDINLLLKDYDKRSEILSYKTQVLSFESPNIDSFPKEDQRLINTFWNKSDYSVLFIEDTLGNIHSSNKIPFSEGTYERIIYNRLATEASKTRYFSE
jgi:hypothetical protein